MQLERAIHRYRFAADLARGTSVVEAGCGSGQGLAILASSCPDVVATDVDPANVAVASENAPAHVRVVRADAEEMPFRNGAFGAVICLEAIYYLPRPARFVAEARRILKPGGSLIISSVNRRWRGFVSSPHATTYHSAGELYGLLVAGSFRAEVYGAFPEGTSRMSALRAAIRAAAFRLDLIPGSLSARAALKRLFYGPLSSYPRLLSAGSRSSESVVPLSQDSDDRRFSIIYAVGR